MVKDDISASAALARASVPRVYDVNGKTPGAPKGALAIFAKTIGLSPTKTRLAARIGTKSAEEFYLQSIDCIGAIAAAVEADIENQITSFWAVAEQHGLAHEVWRNRRTLWTGRGSLGRRLHRIYGSLLRHHDFVIVIGTDSPQLSPSVIGDAARRLAADYDFVVGPAEDGGFYLFGGRRPLPDKMWTAIHYSVPATYSELYRSLSIQGSVNVMPLNYDVDTLADLLRLRSEIGEIDTNELNNLKAWVDRLLANRPDLIMRSPRRKFRNLFSNTCR